MIIYKNTTIAIALILLILQSCEGLKWELDKRAYAFYDKPISGTSNDDVKTSLLRLGDTRASDYAANAKENNYALLGSKAGKAWVGLFNECGELERQDTINDSGIAREAVHNVDGNGFIVVGRESTEDVFFLDLSYEAEPMASPQKFAASIAYELGESINEMDIYDIKPLNDKSGYILTGYYKKSVVNGSTKELFLIITDKQGNFIDFANVIKENQDVVGMSITQLLDDDIAVLGVENQNIILYRFQLNSLSTFTQSSSLGNALPSRFMTLRQADDRNLLIAATVMTTSNDFNVLKVNSATFDTNLEIIWERKVGSTNTGEERGHFISDLTHDGHRVVIGYREETPQNKLFIVKIDESNGSVLLESYHDASLNELPVAIYEANDYGFLCLSLVPTSASSREFRVIKTDGAGIIDESVYDENLCPN